MTTARMLSISSSLRTTEVPKGMTAEEHGQVGVHLDDKALLRRAQEGDKEAFQDLFEKYKNRVFSIAYDLLKSREDAEDVTQECFVKAYFSLKNFRGDSSILTWFYRIVYNLCVDQKRRVTRRGGEAIEFDESLDSILSQPNDTGPHELLLRKERARRIQLTLSKLSEDHRQVIVLREIDGLSYEEIADALGVSKGTVMSRLHYARRNLQEALKEYGPLRVSS